MANNPIKLTHCSLDRSGPSYRLSLSRRPFNGLTPEFCDELTHCLEQANVDKNCRCLLLESETGCFSVGADLKWAAAKRAQGENGLADLVNAMHRTILAIYSCPKPVVCLVAGPAAGGGLGLALAADIRLATPNAKFRLAYPQVGISVDGGASFRMPQLIGLGKVQTLLYSDRDLSAQQAAEWGLIHEVVEVPEQLEAWLARLSSGPTLAWAKSKFLVNDPSWVSQRLDLEAKQIESLAESPDTWSGVQAFLDKVQPTFVGQ